MDFKKICLDSCDAVTKVAGFIQAQQSVFTSDKVEIKGRHDFVSYVDKTAEQMLVKSLSDIFPPASFIVEEKSVAESQTEFQWIVDPLDGTTNFIHGVPLYSISVALYRGDEPLLGIIYEVNHNECFYTWKDGAAFLNGREIRVSSTPTLDVSLLATGFPYSDYSRLDGFMELLRWSMENTRGLRRLGSAALDLAWVACGRFDGFFEYGLNPWDVAAGAFLVKQAGGRNADFSGGADFIHGREIISCNKPVFDELLLNVNKYLAMH